MRQTTLAAAAVLLVAAVPALAKTEHEQLTAEMAGRIAQVAPDVKITIEGPLTLKLIGGPQGEAQINLDRIADFCAANAADECEASKAAFVKGVAEIATDALAVTRQNLRVIVRPADYAVAMQETIAAKGKKLVTRPIGDGLVALLAADFPSTTSLVATADLQALGLAEAEAFELGRRNVLEALPCLPTTAELQSKIIMIAGHDYDASLLLADGWRELAAQTNGKLFVTVADASQLVVGLTEDGDEAQRLRQITEEDFRSAERGISPKVYRWSEKGWLAVR